MSKLSIPENLDVWVMAGQSNMEGCGLLRQGSKPDPKVWLFSMRHQWKIAREPLHDKVHSVAAIDQRLMAAVPAEAQNQYADLFRGCGAGLGIAFGKAWSQATRKPVGLIAAAHGGTSLEQWSHEKSDEGLGSLYGAMLERIRLAGGRLRGILWYQGESDVSAEAAPLYRERFIAWVNAVRRDTGIANLPVLTVQLGCTTGDWINVSGWDAIRETQLALASELRQVGITSAVDLELNDFIHLDAPSLIRLGQRLARQALHITGKKKSSMGPHLAAMESGRDSHGVGFVRLRFTGVEKQWQPATHLAGFSLLDVDGKPHPKNGIFAAGRDPRRPNVIALRTNLPLLAGESVAYGRGINPHCNVVDAADMPLCAFSRTTDTSHHGPANVP